MLYELAREVEQVYMERVASSEEREAWIARSHEREFDRQLDMLEARLRTDFGPAKPLDQDEANHLMHTSHMARELERNERLTEAQHQRAKAIIEAVREVMLG